MVAGAHLRSDISLRQELGVGKWALRHGLQLLRDEGLVRTVRGTVRSSMHAIPGTLLPRSWSKSRHD
jgi:DNA-binding FadR family transcriptional regulator